MCVGEVIVHVEEWLAGTKERCASFVQWTMDCYHIPLFFSGAKDNAARQAPGASQVGGAEST